MSKEELIRDALISAKNQNIILTRDCATFDWTHQSEWPRPKWDKPLPAACNWFGAVLIKLGFTKLDSEAWAAVKAYLNVESYWVYRFDIGFNQGRQLTKRIKDGDKEKFVDDPTSKLGQKMAKNHFKT